jgi:DNA-binding response OmpR family regulator
VLVVDDEPPLRRIIRRRLEAEHFQVEEAGDGESALRLIQSRAFDLVLTDLLMPEINGRQIHETLKQYRPTVAVLCMSAYAEEVPPIDPADTALALLRKPFSADELYLAIRAELTRASNLIAVAESEIMQAKTGLSRMALSLRESRTARRQSVDLVAAARELLETAPPSKSTEVHGEERSATRAHANNQEASTSEQ